MRSTPRDELTSDLIRILANAYDSADLTEQENLLENHHNAEEIIRTVWKHIEPFVIDNNGALIFDYGMLKHTLGE